MRCILAAQKPVSGSAAHRSLPGAKRSGCCLTRSHWRLEARIYSPHRVVRSLEPRQEDSGDAEEPERDENGLYIGTYSTFFTDPEQLKGFVAFCLFLATFFIGAQILSGLLLPYLFGGVRGVHPDVTSLEYWTKF
mmetsp:Transcript_9781/g.27983  ORF Transcript_9781/g.27983 Transcript_9781/m.27983 type:complete len:135 (-) Transcript_9781:192-596(-)|eukprot:CAMPEP_0117672316 /NCGR_PEP_ID=MMETSP0804-20121206/13833_1 /TAXON_ID=1074897 /ORGANISM="Tetraselmis astigmatica, Strain CCMP880" /LENGTH=134 /DNA_ID=CAMNT_0005480897 /DNA_START=160 /DNA_END=564 /DNA_ORIENTATION=-